MLVVACSKLCLSVRARRLYHIYTYNEMTARLPDFDNIQGMTSNIQTYLLFSQRIGSGGVSMAAVAGTAILIH